MTDGPLTDEEREEIASALWDWFSYFKQAGFTGEQALALCRTMLTGVL